MRTIRHILAWFFSLVALVNLVFVYVVLHPPERAVPLSPNVRWPTLAVCVPLLTIFGLAWWMVRRNAASARKWALAASVLTVLLGGGLPLLLNSVMSWPAWILIGIGVAGIIAFSMRSGDGAAAEQPARLPLPGDGTVRWINVRLLSGVGIVAAIAAGGFWDRWGNAHGLPPHFSVWITLQVLLAGICVAILHEAGHAIGGRCFGMRVAGLVLGPLMWWYIDGKPRLCLKFARTSFWRWQTLVVPASLEKFRQRKLAQVAAGPIVSIATGLGAAALVFTAHGRPWESQWDLIAPFASISLIAGVLNLVPFSIDASGYSDGAKLFQLRKPGLWSDYYLLLGMMCGLSATPIRPRDLDIETMEKVAGTLATGVDELWIRLNIYAYFLDRGKFAKAAEALNKAEACRRENNLSVPSEWHTEFVFGFAFLHHDSTRARAWWSQLEAMKDFKLSGPRWTTLSALLWSEGRLDEAKEALEKAEAWLRTLPDTGFAAVEGYAFRLLKAAVNESPCTSSDAAFAIEGSDRAL